MAKDWEDRKNLVEGVRCSWCGHNRAWSYPNRDREAIKCTKCHTWFLEEEHKARETKKKEKEEIEKEEKTKEEKKKSKLKKIRRKLDVFG